TQAVRIELCKSSPSLDLTPLFGLEAVLFELHRLCLDCRSGVDVERDGEDPIEVHHLHSGKCVIVPSRCHCAKSSALTAWCSGVALDWTQYSHMALLSNSAVNQPTAKTCQKYTTTVNI